MHNKTDNINNNNNTNSNNVNNNNKNNNMDNVCRIQEMITNKKYIEAEIILTNKIESNPKACFYYLRSQCHYNLELYFIALHDINEALKIIQYDPAKYFLRYQILTALTHHDLALADLERVTLLDPNFPGLCESIEKIYHNSTHIMKLSHLKTMPEATRKRIKDNCHTLLGLRFNIHNKNISFKRLLIDNVSEILFHTLKDYLELFGKYDSLNYQYDKLDINYDCAYSAFLTKIFLENVFNNRQRIVRTVHNQNKIKCHFDKVKVNNKSQNSDMKSKSMTKTSMTTTSRTSINMTAINNQKRKKFNQHNAIRK